jgi:hypothetical protein
VLVSSVYFRCTAQSAWIAAAGPAGNLVMSAAAWTALQAAPARLNRWRWFLMLIGAFSVFWEAGYLLSSTVLGEGDWAIAARAALGDSSWHWRPLTTGLGVVLYVLGARLTGAAVRSIVGGSQTADRRRWVALLRTSWIAAGLAASLAAAAYAPDRITAIRQAFLEIGAASLPMLILPARIRRGTASPAPPIRRHLGWIAFAGAVYAAFVATLGRGIY